MIHKMGQGFVRDQYSGKLITKSEDLERFKVSGFWTFLALDHAKKTKWYEEVHNLVVTLGLNKLLDDTLGTAAATASWFLGLTAASPSPALADTMSSHAGWTENVTYSDAARQAWTENAAASAGVITNSGAPAQFGINGSTTVGGAFLTSNNTKSGTSGILFSCAAFASGNRSLISGDTLFVTAQFTISN